MRKLRIHEERLICSRSVASIINDKHFSFVFFRFLKEWRLFCFVFRPTFWRTVFLRGWNQNKWIQFCSVKHLVNLVQMDDKFRWCTSEFVQLVSFGRNHQGFTFNQKKNVIASKHLISVFEEIIIFQLLNILFCSVGFMYNMCFLRFLRELTV